MHSSFRASCTRGNEGSEDLQSLKEPKAKCGARANMGAGIERT